MKLRLFIIMVLAALITALQFALVPLFSSECADITDVEQITAVRMIRLPDVAEPDVSEEPPPPEPPQSEPIDLSTEISIDVELDLPAFEINPRLDGGIAVSAPGIYGLGDLDQRPVSVYRAEPHYPARAQQRGIQGKVKVQFVINASGKAEQIKIIETDHPGVFEKSVIKAIKASTFKPGILDGEVVATRIVTSYGFKL